MNWNWCVYKICHVSCGIIPVTLTIHCGAKLYWSYEWDVEIIELAVFPGVCTCFWLHLNNGNRTPFAMQLTVLG